MNPDDNLTYVFGTPIAPAKGQATVTLAPNVTLLRASGTASVNLTWQFQAGNVSAAASAQVLFVPTQGGAPSAGSVDARGLLNASLAPGTYELHAKATAPDGSTWTLTPPKPFTVTAAGTVTVVAAELTRSG
jgi:hypothetical protein